MVEKTLKKQSSSPAVSGAEKRVRSDIKVENHCYSYLSIYCFGSAWSNFF